MNKNSKLIIISLVFITVLLMLSSATTAQGAVTGGTVTGNTARDLTVGTSSAVYNVIFDTSVTATATIITVTFPVNFTITDGSVGPTSTAICSGGCASAGTISVNGATTSVSSVVGTSSTRSIAITLATSTNLSVATGTEFRLLLGIKNATTSGATGTSTITSDATGETAQTNVSGVTLTADTASQLAFLTQPSGSVSGAAFTTQPVVEALDQFGNLKTTFAGTVSLSLATGAGTLSGPVTTSSVSGIATSTGIIYTATADQESFSLTASSSPLTSATSNAIASNVVATKIVIHQQPVAGTSGSLFSTQPVIYFVDANDTLDSQANTDAVTASFVSSDTGSLAGTTSVSASNGVITFTDLSYTTPAAGTSFLVRFTDDTAGTNNFNSSPVDSSSFTSSVPGSVSVAGNSGGGGTSYSTNPPTSPTPTSTTPLVTPPTFQQQQQLLASLIAQLNSLKQLARSKGITFPEGSMATSFGFTRSLQLRSTGEDVRQLQIFLNGKGFTVNQTGGAGSPGNETALFGRATQTALAKYQKSVGISPAVGYFGPITRAYIQAHP